MSAVRAIAPQLRALNAPEALREIPQWLCWRYESNGEREKPLKVPYWTDFRKRHGAQGSPEDRARLTTFAAARDAAIRLGMDGVGFALLPGTGIAALDFDHCVDADGNIPDEIMQIVGRTYAEYSPSGTGVRAFLRGNLGNHKSKATADRYGAETFSSTGFVTFTGNLLPTCELLGYENRIAEVDHFTTDFFERRFGQLATSEGSFDPDDFMAGREPRLGLTISEIEGYVNALDADIGHDDWLRVGMAVHHETDGGDDGFDIWDEWSSEGDSYPGTEALRHRWDSFRPTPGRRSTTMASVIKMAKEAGYRPSEAVSRDEVLAKAEAIMAELPNKAEKRRFAPEHGYALSLRPPGEWIIKGVLPKANLFAIYGPSGSGKTFVALDMAFAIATGEPWRGRRVVKGRVVIIAAEGGAGLGKRLQAHSRYHCIDLQDIELYVITAAPNFLETDDVSEVIAEIKALGDVSVIFVDTVAQVSPGANENTSEDMGKVLRNMDTMGDATGATVAAVHHSGKDISKGARGWSGFRAAMDGQLEVLRHEDGSREIRVDKMKDGEDGTKWPFKLEVIELGFDADGDVITSCVAVEADPVSHEQEGDRKGVRRRGRIENHVLEAMAIFGQQDAVDLEALVRAAVDSMPAPEQGQRDIRRQSVFRAIRNLSREKDGPLQLVGGRIVFYE